MSVWILYGGYCVSTRQMHRRRGVFFVNHRHFFLYIYIIYMCLYESMNVGAFYYHDFSLFFGRDASLQRICNSFQLRRETLWGIFSVSVHCQCFSCDVVNRPSINGLRVHSWTWQLSIEIQWNHAYRNLMNVVNLNAIGNCPMTSSFRRNSTAQECKKWRVFIIYSKKILKSQWMNEWTADLIVDSLTCRWVHLKRCQNPMIWSRDGSRCEEPSSPTKESVHWKENYEIQHILLLVLLSSFHIRFIH